jgi:hypothetical protein
MKCKNIIFALFLLSNTSLSAQKSKAILKNLKTEQFVMTGVGLSFLNPSFKQVSKNGFTTYTAFESQIQKKYWLRLTYGGSFYGFDNVVYNNGYKISNKGTRNFLGVFIDGGYRYAIDKFACYGFGGAGVGSLSGQLTTVDPVNQEVKTEPLNKIHASIRAGLGFEYEFKPKIIPFIEYQYGSLLGNTKFDDRKLIYSNLSIGIKARLKRKK